MLRAKTNACDHGLSDGLFENRQNQNYSIDK